jgi:hypothetical protein
MTETELIDAPTGTVIKFSVSESDIAERSDRYLSLTIADLDDIHGAMRVSVARKDIKKMIGVVEKARKEQKAESLAYGRRVDSEATRIKTLLEPIHSHLVGEEDKISREKESIARAKAEAHEQQIIARLDKFDAVGLRLVRADVQGMSPVEFESSLQEATIAHAKRLDALRIQQEEQEKSQAEEDERRRVEKKMLDDERAELDREKAAAAEERAKLDAEIRVAELAKAKQDAAEQRILDEQDRVQREVDAAIVKELDAAAEKERLEALRPDQERLRSVVELLSNISVPDVHGTEAEAVAKVIRTVLDSATAEISRFIDDM